MIVSNGRDYDNEDEVSSNEASDDDWAIIEAETSLVKTPSEILISMLQNDDDSEKIYSYIKTNKLHEFKQNNGMNLLETIAYYCKSKLLTFYLKDIQFDDFTLKSLMCACLRSPKTISDDRVCSCLDVILDGLIKTKSDAYNSHQRFTECASNQQTVQLAERPLTQAIKQGRRLAVEKLLSTRDATICDDLNESDDCGWTALAYAMQKGDRGIVNLLLDYGANVNFRTIENFTAISISRNHTCLRYMFQGLLHSDKFKTKISPGMCTILSALNLEHLTDQLQRQGITDLCVLKLMNDKLLSDAGIAIKDERTKLCGVFSSGERGLDDDWPEILRNIKLHFRYFKTIIYQLGTLFSSHSSVFWNRKDTLYTLKILAEWIDELSQLRIVLSVMSS
ncbi:hypothetical protein GJ496_006266 [Pomphorhynchus laevis]|nr:hypothetical protein GJ496_006266 [Pomphorhynchus laevis]